MRLSASNIAWQAEKDESMYALLGELGFEGLEIAPSRLFGPAPYDRAEDAAAWAEDLRARHDLVVSSMQSIWYGRSEEVFGEAEGREALLSYTREAILFAEAVGCGNLVFGCPRNRRVAGRDSSVAVPFFRELGDFAHEHHTVLALEANPPIYDTDYLNATADALALAREVASPGLLVNLDLGTMVQNGERVADVDLSLVNHVHVSEPHLAVIDRSDERLAFHREVARALRSAGYEGFVSLEMGSAAGEEALMASLERVREAFS